MEEDGKDTVMNLECPGKLNFNAPLLSIRRPAGMKRLEMPRPATSLRVSRDFSSSSSTVRIPFSWEQTPGKPKGVDNTDESSSHHDHVRNNNIVDLDFLPPPPKLPPCRWFPSTEEEEAEADGRKIMYINDDIEDGFDGDVEDYCKEDDDKDDRDESDAIDVFSLGQSVEVVDEPGEGVEMFGFEGLEVEAEEAYYNHHRDRGGSHSPNFIIQRFLPDAKALAASSAATLSSSNTINNEEDLPRHHEPSGGGRDRRPRAAGLSRAISVRRSSYLTSITKGCGLDIFFPWRMKPKPCGTKNPVVLAAGLGKKPQVQCTRRDK